MHSTCNVSSSPLQFHPFSGHPKVGIHSGRRLSYDGARVLASRQDAHDQYDYRGRMVDENMIVLRKRIHEMKMVERNYEPPLDWMDWEKRYYTSYDSLICEAVGILQTKLMNTRPSLTLGMVALIALSVSTSTALALCHLVEISKVVFAGIRLG